MESLTHSLREDPPPQLAFVEHIFCSLQYGHYDNPFILNGEFLYDNQYSDDDDEDDGDDDDDNNDDDDDDYDDDVDDDHDQGNKTTTTKTKLRKLPQQRQHRKQQ